MKLTINVEYKKDEAAQAQKFADGIRAAFTQAVDDGVIEPGIVITQSDEPTDSGNLLYPQAHEHYPVVLPKFVDAIVSGIRQPIGQAGALQLSQGEAAFLFELVAARVEFDRVWAEQGHEPTPGADYFESILANLETFFKI